MRQYQGEQILGQISTGSIRLVVYFLYRICDVRLVAFLIMRKNKPDFEALSTTSYFARSTRRTKMFTRTCGEISPGLGCRRYSELTSTDSRPASRWCPPSSEDNPPSSKEMPVDCPGNVETMIKRKLN